MGDEKLITKTKITNENLLFISFTVEHTLFLKSNELVQLMSSEVVFQLQPGSKNILEKLVELAFYFSKFYIFLIPNPNDDVLIVNISLSPARPNMEHIHTQSPITSL